MFYVYYLLAADSDELLYIGRSDKPLRRQSAFHKLHHVLTIMGECQRFSTFEEACAAEIKAISKNHPPFNRLVTSSRGAYGYKHTEHALAKVRAAAMKPKSQVTKTAMNKPKSEKHKQAMRKPKNPEHAAKLAETLKVARLKRKAVINFKGR